jgi:hypothetical protein
LDSIFDLYEKIEKKVPFEYSEVILFKANVLENMGEIKKAIKFVEKK